MSPSQDGPVVADGSHDDHHHHHGDKHHHDHHHHHEKTSALDPEVEAKGVQDILDALTEEEKKELVDDHMVLRHFRAEKGNEKKALHQLQETLQWRKSFGVDAIVQAQFTGPGVEDDTAHMLRTETETGKIYVRGYDHDGRAIMYMRPQRENTHHAEHNMKNLVYNLERAIACTKKKSNQTQEKICLVIDFDGYQLRHAPPMHVSRMTLDILQKHYPERMYRAYVCNAPFIFRTFFALIRPFIDPITKQKIVMCHGKHGYDTMSEHLHVEALEPSILMKLQIPKKVDTTDKPVFRDFDHNEYLAAPFDTAFDETLTPNESISSELTKGLDETLAPSESDSSELTKGEGVTCKTIMTGAL